MTRRSQAYSSNGGISGRSQKNRKFQLDRTTCASQKPIANRLASTGRWICARIWRCRRNMGATIWAQKVAPVNLKIDCSPGSQRPDGGLPEDDRLLRLRCRSLRAFGDLEPRRQLEFRDRRCNELFHPLERCL